MEISKTILEELSRYNQINNYIFEQAPPAPEEVTPPVPGAETPPPPGGEATPPATPPTAEAEPTPVDVAADPDVEKVGEEKDGNREELEITDLVKSQREVSEKQEEYSKQFEYRKKCILNTTDVNQLEHTDVKKDRIKFYEKQQKDLEIDNAKVLNVVRDLKNTGILTEEQINETLKMM